jgi:hypothetical protein
MSTGMVAGVGAAAVGGVVAVKKMTGADCTFAKDQVEQELQAEFDVCDLRHDAPSCQAVLDRAVEALGDWCSCEGTQKVNASLGAEDTSLADLEQVLGWDGRSLPASCR